MNKQEALARLAEAEDVAVGVEEEQLEAAFGPSTPITVQANYHVTFTVRGRREDAWIEFDDRGDGHWFVFGHVSQQIQDTKYATSADAIAAVGTYVNPNQEVEVTL